MHHYRPIEPAREKRLVGRAEVTAPFKRLLEFLLRVALLEHLHGLIVLQARKGWNNVLKLSSVSLEKLELLGAILENPTHDVTDELLSEFHDVVKPRIGNLRLDH